MNAPTVRIKPVTPAIGAEISGIDLSTDLSDLVIRQIRDAFLKHLVLFFRDQNLTPSELVRFSKCFGEIGYYPFVEGMEAQPEVVEVEKKENETINFGGLWHTDTSYLEIPPMGSVLYAVEVPETGGDTLFSNMYLAYDSLSLGMKELLSGLRGVNSSEKPDAAVTRVNRMTDKPKDHEAVTTTSVHPIVRTHPETGRKALYCSNAHTLFLEGLTPEESSPILSYLYGIQQREEFSCRLRWAPGTLAFWDNRASQHNALNDYHGSRRVMRRVTLKGDIPS